MHSWKQSTRSPPSRKMSARRAPVLRAYRGLLREGSRYNNYNFREYILRRVKEEFRDNKTVQDPVEIEKLLQKAQQNLDVVRRQALISRLYPHQPLVLEGLTKDV